MTESGKGRPTPKRSQAQGRRTGPVAPPPTTRREAAKRMRAKNAERRGKVRKGSREGDPKALLARDTGPVRKLVRDVVDSRRHPAVLLLPAAVIPLVASFQHDKALVNAATLLWVVALMVAIADFTGTALLIRTAVRRDHPGERPGRHIGYGLMRVTQTRKWRIPRPTVSIGAKP